MSALTAITAEPTASADDTGRGAQPPESSGARVRPRHSAVAGVARVASVRVLRLITLLIGVSLLAFTLVQHSPIDPIQAYIGADVNISDEQLARLRDYWGLNAPPAERYLHWMGAQLSGNLGTSTLFKQPVADVIASRALASAALMCVAWLLSGVLGYVLGVIAAVRRGRVADRVISAYSFVLSATPVFWLGILFLVVFAVQLGWFPVGLAGPHGVPTDQVSFAQRVQHFALPALTLSVVGVANVAMHTRERMTAVLASDHVLFARARGASPWQIFTRHGFRNSIVPALTLQFAYFAELFGGSVLAENVFAYPGLGSTLTAAALGGDIPLLLGIILIAAIFVFTGNALAQVLAAVIDPRVRGRA